MIEFMDYVQHAFSAASYWDHDNSYSTLTATAQALLDFQTPHGLRMHISSLSAPNFATSYTLGNRGVVDGSVSYLYSSLALSIPSKSSQIDLHHLIRGYRHLAELRKQDEPWHWEIWHRGRRVDRRDALLYGRIYLPTSALEALYLRRVSPSRLLRLSAVSDSALPNGGTILAVLQNDHGKYSTEYLYSTDSALFGIRGLYNFGHDPRNDPAPSISKQPPSSVTISPPGPVDPQHGRLSAGAEAYFSPLNKSGGMSTGVRFTTLPAHTGFPYTMTLTLNPLMGNVSSSYAVKAGQNLALCSRFNFNFYSYESDVQLGMELWRPPTVKVETPPPTPDNENVERIVAEGVKGADDINGVLKVKGDQNWKIGILWEGRIKELLVSIGAGLDLKRRDRIIGSVGLEVSYSS